MDLFSRAAEAEAEKTAPLAHRMRPRSLDEFVGQEHIVGPGRLLRRAIEADQLSSLIFYGPPGTGKTTLAMVIANTTRSHFLTINAVLAGVAQIRAAIKEAKERRAYDERRTLLFVDEVHRWNKAQQDALLPHVEKGTIILIGATTENPYFEVNKALVSRSRIFQLKPLAPTDLEQVARNALVDEARGYGAFSVELEPKALAHLVGVANGDARSVLNALELAVETTPPDDDGVIEIDLAVAEESIQRRAVLYDKEGDVHYDTISAFIKSLRGSDPDAALYWMAKMVYAGEDARFIFRRMAILASEDVGLADPQAAGVVASCWDLFEKVGMPEGRFHLAQAALYLATCPKSNTAFAFFDALKTIAGEREGEVPNHLKDASRDKEGFGHGEGYLYPHAYRDHWVAQQYLPEAMQGRVFYEPSKSGYERGIRDQVARRREAQLAAMVEQTSAVPEILTTSPRHRAREAWLQRAISSAGRQLADLRDQLFERARIQRHHVVLDLNAGSGLLTWEAVRQAPEGGVWAQTADPQAARSLRQQAERLPELDRVTVLRGPLADLENLLEAVGASEALRFDRIVGRNALTVELAQAAPDAADGAVHRVARWSEWLRRLRGRLHRDGLLCLGQHIPQRTQRLHELIDWNGEEGLRAAAEAAEETIYRSAGDPLVGWDAGDLERAVAEAGFESPRLRVLDRTERRLISEDDLARWFGPTPATSGSRPRYALRLREAGLDEETVTTIAAFFRAQLQGQGVPWRSTWALVTAGD